MLERLSIVNANRGHANAQMREAKRHTSKMFVGMI